MSRYDDDYVERTQATPAPGVLPTATPPPHVTNQQMLPYMTPYPPIPVKRKRRRIPSGCLGCLVALLTLSAVVACGSSVLVTVVWNAYSSQLTNRLAKRVKVAATQTFQTTRIYDRNGDELHEIFDQGRRTIVKLADIPQSMIDATIAVEDNTFYENPGVEWTAITRAGLEYFQTSGSGTGASTITQQLVRNIAFDFEYRAERSARRKIEEIIMALILTRQMSKNDILEMYLNQIYYGNLAYGIEAAAQTYFGKSAKDLTLSESALLAGLPQTPAELDPLNPDPKIQEAVLARRRVVLDLMVSKGKITQAQESDALTQALVYANPNVSLKSPHFTLYAEQELKTLLDALKLSPDILTMGGLSVYTTLDARYEALAEKVAGAQIASIKVAHNANNAAVVILQPGTGEILAMMGSVNYKDDSIQGRVNVATSPKQPGSAMKPLTYAAAMEKGFTAATVLWDVETHIGTTPAPYSPRNYDGQFHGPVRVRDALANSYNIPAVQTLRQIGVDTLLSYAERVGVHSLGMDASQYGLSLTLGGGELTPLELTQAYSVFANGGNFVPATSILCIIDSNGNILYEYERGCNGRGLPTDKTYGGEAIARPVLDPRIAFLISDILADNGARTPAMGPNSPLRTDGLVTSVKTGTTNDYKDNWTVGFTKNVAVGVWVGNTDSKPMVNSTGLTGASPIWHDVITGIYADPALLNTLKQNGNLIPDTLTAPQGMTQQQICYLSTLKDPATGCTRHPEWFLCGPAGVPDSNGKIAIPACSPQVAPTPIPAGVNGPVLVEIDPGVVQTLVFPLNPVISSGISANDPGPVVPPAPSYCLVPNEVRDQVPGAQYQYFIKPPVFPDDLVYSRIYAARYGSALQPTIPCTPDMLVSGPQVGVTARISVPRAGDTVTGTVYVKGVVSWSPGQAAYFKMEIQGPSFPNWTTFGNGHIETPVINGDLDNFGATGLQPGTYKLRIVVVGVDGNYLMTSLETPINVTGQ